MAGCEGDIPLMLSMALGSWSTGKPVFMGNLVSIKPSEVVIAHCTSYIPNGCPYELHTHFESGRSVGLRVDYPIGNPATLFRIDPGLRKLRVALGQIIRHEWKTTMCRTQARIKLDNAEKLVREPLGNHYVMILGDHVEELTLIAKLLGMYTEVV